MALIRAEDLITPEQKSRTWRNAELARTDIAATISDYPNADAYITYREALRQWPSKEDWPHNPPELGD